MKSNIIGQIVYGIIGLIIFIVLTQIDLLWGEFSTKQTFKEYVFIGGLLRIGLIHFSIWAFCSLLLIPKYIVKDFEKYKKASIIIYIIGGLICILVCVILGEGWAKLLSSLLFIIIYLVALSPFIYDLMKDDENGNPNFISTILHFLLIFIIYLSCNFLIGTTFWLIEHKPLLGIIMGFVSLCIIVAMIWSTFFPESFKLWLATREASSSTNNNSSKSTKEKRYYFGSGFSRVEVFETTTPGVWVDSQGNTYEMDMGYGDSFTQTVTTTSGLKLYRNGTDNYWSDRNGHRYYSSDGGKTFTEE